ncbi:protein phosphatase 1 regulatory subunit 12A isoform X10 [Cephus cinctus]|uniref:Protein phosphatase 1 regulatory subunit 12B n=1 Tax=Cephus cinctus TaxID=211228 RepID=A0AAJ7FLY9_CEPCN|nr:protein phosphatase 1 regulatory subunit 12A isoform X10 [Cephus cinctus]
MSIETRSSSALFKRAEQLKRWEQSETNREPAQPRQVARKIKFSADCVFLAACAAGDKDEVVRLLQKGADINTGNVDGLTALHQACIDDDLDMVEFLVEQGADINRGDNEGWTPLHATASCGFISIAKYLIEQGCNLAAVNNDGELALDIAESDEMEDMLQQHINKAGIDCDQARSEEERSMLNDARAWRSGVPGKDNAHPRSGATALHVAAAKGYLKVMNVLLQARCDVNVQDFDGWTPLHGAAHWGQLEACKLLVENFCDMDIKNYAGQTAFDVADADILKALEELKKKQQVMLKDHPQINNKKQPSIPKKRVSTNNENAVVTQEGVETFEEETPNKVKKVELEIQSDKEDSSAATNSDVEGGAETDMDASDGEGDSETSSDSHTSSRSDQSNKSNQSDHSACLTDDEKKNRVNRDETASHSPSSTIESNKVPNQAPILPPKQQTENNEDGSIPSWRRSGSFRSRNQDTEATNSITTRLEDKEKSVPKSPTSPNKINVDQDVPLRRTHSFETDEKRKEVKLNLELSRVPQGSNTSSPTSVSNKLLSSPTLPASTTTSTATTTTTTSPVSTNQIRRSFVPPVRDEESETQRKAHAKRVRETRRSTQGVTLDEIKSAEQLVKKKQQQNNETTTATPVPSTQFQLEDANNRSADTATAYIRRPSGGTSVPRPSSAPVETITASTAETTVTLPLRRPLKPPEDKEQDKENDSRNAQATQAVIQRRRRPKRRSTGVVHVDMDEIDPERQDTSAGGDYDDSKVNHNESGTERSGRSSRLGSVSSVSSDAPTAPARTKSVTSENGELDYKKLYEESQAENERLREKLRRSDEQLKETKGLLDKAQTAQNKSSLSEAEKRERRAMERKLSEMEEELKQLQKLKAENERLKAENRALTRVVSKLTNTTK